MPNSPTPLEHPIVCVVTGTMASGKSTLAQLLAEHPPKSVHLRGDAFRRMVVRGRAEMTPDPSPEALGQLDLRYRLAAGAARTYLEAGFSVVWQDVILGDTLERVVSLLHGLPLHLVVLCPSVEAVRAREAARAKTGYGGGWTVEGLHAALERTPRLGLWLDSTGQTPEQTLEMLLGRWDEARVT